MNYRHAFHAGNFADVLKHAVIALCIEHLKQKPKPFRVIDTHAGVGAYDLTSEAAKRSPEWRDGVGRLLDAAIPAGPAAALAPYLGAVRAMNEGGGLTHYPGSPELAARLLREADRAHLCELHEADAKTLDARYALDARIKVERRDGYRALAALLPPRERRGLVLIDPPFEAKDEFAALARALMGAVERWPTGMFAVWRPLKDLWAAQRFDAGLGLWLLEDRGVAPENLLRADLWVRDLEAEGRLAGAGLIVINPPHTLEGRLLALLPWLAQTLAQGPGAGWRLDGAVTEADLQAL